MVVLLFGIGRDVPSSMGTQGKKRGERALWTQGAAVRQRARRAYQSNSRLVLARW